MPISILGGGNAQKKAKNGDLIKDATTQDFVQDVLEASKTTPVLVDFWAPWCGPCRQLTPILEKAVQAAGGAVKLVKMNIDEHPSIPSQLGVQSIPAVFAFKNGRPVDGFMGALPESQVKSFIERIAGKDAFAGSAAEAAAEALDAGDVNTAAELFAGALQRDAENAEAIAGLAKCYLATGDLTRAEQTLALVPPGKQAAGAVTSAKASLDLARKSAKAGNAAALESALAKDANNLQARFDLAIALNAKGNRQGAMEHLFAIMRKNRGWNEDAARKQLIQFFDAWGPDHPLTVDGRQHLSSLLFA